MAERGVFINGRDDANRFEAKADGFWLTRCGSSFGMFGGFDRVRDGCATKRGGEQYKTFA